MSLTTMLVVANVAVFWYQLALGRGQETFLARWGLVPEALARLLAGDLSRFGALITPFTATFLHASWPHLLGNLLYLWFFGRPLEAGLGRFRFALVYVVAGGLAALAHVASGPSSSAPAVGASGAVAGLVGGYLPLRLVPPRMAGWSRTAEVLAALLLALWLASLALGGILLAVGSPSGPATLSWWGHLAGLTSGLILVCFFRFLR